MTEWQLNTPVALIIFNRPDTTQKVFDAIRQAKPPMLLVIADGHRLDKPEDLEKCAATRAIIEQVDWRCQVLKNYADINLGCKKRVSSGLNWVFDTVEEAIILEDDCLPHSTFFHFCEELLDYYRHDKRIMMISGDNFLFGQKRTEYSYYFSRYINIWGWATWRRAWQYYDIEMDQWPKIRDGNWLQDIFCNSRTVYFWQKIFQSTYDDLINTWDYQWVFACWLQNSISVVPNVNLISNIGFDRDSTHTTEKASKASLIPTEQLMFPLNHPSFVICDTLADNFVQNNFFSCNLLQRMQRRFKKLKSNNLFIKRE